MLIRFAVLTSVAVALVPTIGVADDSLPDFDKVREVVAARLSGGRSDFPDRLLTRRDVEPVFPAIAKLGWDVPDPKAFVVRFLPDNDPLARELRNPRSAEFAKSVAKLPNVYDRLDRLRRMPYGMRRIREFAGTPGGSKLLEYMTTTKGGARLERQIARGQDGRDFDQPTNRLYTQKDLLNELQMLYDAESGRATVGEKRSSSGRSELGGRDAGDR